MEREQISRNILRKSSSTVSAVLCECWKRGPSCIRTCVTRYAAYLLGCTADTHHLHPFTGLLPTTHPFPVYLMIFVSRNLEMRKHDNITLEIPLLIYWSRFSQANPHSRVCRIFRDLHELRTSVAFQSQNFETLSIVWPNVDEMFFCSDRRGCCTADKKRFPAARGVSR